MLNPVIINKDEAIVTILKEETEPSKLASNSIGMNQEIELDSSTIQNVNIACQSSNRVSYDICKNNEHVAHVILSRTVYRLSDSISVLINFAASTVPCYQVYLQN